MIYGYVYLTLEHETTIKPVDADIFITAVSHNQCITEDILIFRQTSTKILCGKEKILRNII